MIKCSKRRWIVVAVCILFVAVLVAVVGCVNYHKLYVFAERTGLFCSKTDINEISIELDYFPVGDTIGGRVAYTEDMMLVNTEHRLPEDYIAPVLEYKETDVYMNGEGMLQAYALLSAAVTEKTSLRLYVSSDYRSAEQQAALYLEDPNTATVPGASEHQTGLALDVYVAYYAGDGFLRSPAGRFVNSYAHEYGFIIRYPSYGEDITGIRFEPWHIRYVGKVHANLIYNNHTTLEEHILSMEIGKWYEADGALYSRQVPNEDGMLCLPKDGKTAIVSPDNTGAYIITVP